MSDIEEVALRFTIPAEGDYPEFTDVLYIDKAEYEQMSEEDIESRKQARYANFKSQQDAPQRVLTKADRQENIRQLLEKIRELVAQAVQEGTLKARAQTRLETLLAGFDADRN